MVGIGQELQIEPAVKKLAQEIQINCTEQGHQSVAILGFYTKDGRNTKLNNYLKEKIAKNFQADIFSVIDPNVIDALLESHPFNLSKANNHELLSSYSNYIMENSNQTLTLFLYGQILDEDDDLKITAYLVSDGMFDNAGTASVKIVATEVTDKLMGKVVTHHSNNESTASTQKVENTTTSGNSQNMVKPVQPAQVEQKAEPAQQPKVEQAQQPKSTEPSTSSQSVQYRGGADPLKGLNVAEEKKALQIGQYFALIIGIDKYSGTWPKLSNAVSDAKALENLLKSKYRFDAFRILYDDQATRENIISELEWLTKNVKENDNVLIYYSGHGEFKQELNKGYWVPINATNNSTSNYISNNDIQTFLGGIKSKHTLLVSDACFSGDIFRGKTVTIPFEESERYYSKIYNLVSRKAITSGGIEPVKDGGKEGHSIFAYYLLKGLTGNNNNYYDASQLYDAIRIPVINNSTQTPNFQPIKDTGDEGGQFIFIKK